MTDAVRTAQGFWVPMGRRVARSDSGIGVGRPYFVRELVRGVRITDYCDQANLSTRERLDLFIKVCHTIPNPDMTGALYGCWWIRPKSICARRRRCSKPKASRSPSRTRSETGATRLTPFKHARTVREADLKRSGLSGEVLGSGFFILQLACQSSHDPF